MSDDDALVARRSQGRYTPWRWTNLVVDEFFPPAESPNQIYVGRCRVICRPWVIHEVSILSTANGLRAALPGRPYLKDGQVVLAGNGQPRRVTLMSFLDPLDMESFSAAVIAEVERKWGPLLKSRRPSRASNVEDAAGAVVELETPQLPARYLP